MAEYRLHCFAQSGNAYKVALALDLMGEPWEPVFVDFFRGAAREDAFVALNLMGEVPVLEHGDDVLTQSGAILDWLAERHGRFQPAPGMRHEVLRWLLWDNHKFTANLASWRFLANYLPAEKRNPDVIAFLAGRARAAARVLDRHLAARDWIAGPAKDGGPTIADLSCAGYVYFPEYPIDWQADYPAIAAWAERLRALPGWRHPYDAMPGHPLPGGGEPR